MGDMSIGRSDGFPELAPLRNAVPGKRQRLAEAAQTLRTVRDDLERLNEPFDTELGAVQVRLAILVNDLRDLARMPLSMAGPVAVPDRPTAS